MNIQITLEDIDIEKWGQSNTLESAISLAKEMIKGDADWPEKIRIDACDTHLGKSLSILQRYFIKYNLWQYQFILNLK
jgi:hypothetical protein